MLVKRPKAAASVTSISHRKKHVSKNFKNNRGQQPFFVLIAIFAFIQLFSSQKIGMAV